MIDKLYIDYYSVFIQINFIVVLDIWKFQSHTLHVFHSEAVYTCSETTFILCLNTGAGYIAYFLLKCILFSDKIILIGIFKFTLNMFGHPFKGHGTTHFQTLTIPSLEDVTMKPWVVWKVAMSVMMSWWPTGRDSGPRRGVSSVDPLFCLLWISWWGYGRQEYINTR